MAEKEKYYKTHDIRLRAAKSWWKKFDKWHRENGCRTRSEAVRLAIKLAIK